jgi:hypothetical protein
MCPVSRIETYLAFDRFDLNLKAEEKVLSNGANGVAVMLTFKELEGNSKDKELEGHTAHAVMKILKKDEPLVNKHGDIVDKRGNILVRYSDRKKGSDSTTSDGNLDKNGRARDNLFHEWMAGAAINDFADLFPCFIRTYGAFVRNKKHGIEVQNIPLMKLDKNTEPRIEEVMRPSTGDACRTAGNQAILIEYIQGITFSELLKTNIAKRRTDDLIEVLFQVYYALSSLGNRFTHYDLHLKNVLVYRPDPVKKVLFEYVLSDGKTVRFHSNYIAKIIDYGRCYVRDIEAEVYKIKTDPSCTSQDPKTGCTSPNGTPADRCGFKYYDKEGSIKFKEPNISQDLRMMKTPVREMKEHGLWHGPSVVFKGDYVTPQVKESGLHENKMNNVHDAFEVLLGKIKENSSTSNIYGTLRVDGTNVWTFEKK